MTIKQLASLLPQEASIGPVCCINGMIIVDYADDTFYRRPTCEDNPFFNAQLLLTYDEDRVTIDGGYPEKVDRVLMRPGSVELSLSGGFAGPRRVRFGKDDRVQMAAGSGAVTKGVRREG